MIICPQKRATARDLDFFAWIGDASGTGSVMTTVLPDPPSDEDDGDKEEEGGGGSGAAVEEKVAPQRRSGIVSTESQFTRVHIHPSSVNFKQVRFAYVLLKLHPFSLKSNSFPVRTASKYFYNKLLRGITRVRGLFITRRCFVILLIL